VSAPARPGHGHELRFNRMLGPANVRFDSEQSAPGRLIFDVHDPAVYDMAACDGDSVLYDYPPGGAPTRKAACSNFGPTIDRYVQVWDTAGGTLDVRDACGGFQACTDPWVQVLDHDQNDDDLAAAALEPASAVTASALPRLVLCASACCSSQTACGDAGW
jgi:hypothetical protein